MIFTFRFFDLHANFKHKSGWGAQFFEKIKFRWAHCDQRPKVQQVRGETVRFEKVVQPDQPNRLRTSGSKPLLKVSLWLPEICSCDTVASFSRGMVIWPGLVTWPNATWGKNFGTCMCGKNVGTWVPKTAAFFTVCEKPDRTGGV